MNGVPSSGVPRVPEVWVVAACCAAVSDEIGL